MRQVFRMANNAIPTRGARSLRRGLVPGSLVYNAGKGKESNVERGVAAAPAGMSISVKKTVPATVRMMRARKLSTKDTSRRAKESNGEGNKVTKSKEEPAPEEESQSYFQRPTKEQLLATATSFLHRLHIRFKWPLIRSYRPFNMDDISAFISVYILSHAFLLIAGTTTFFLLVIATINTVGAQEYFARMIGWYLTKESGITVIFESAIVPKWQGKTIRFERVFVSRRPKGVQNTGVRKGSSITAAAAAAAAATAEAGKEEHVEEITDDGNYTQYDLTIESVDVTLSFVRWMNGKGLLENVDVRGVRGVIGICVCFPPTDIDRTHVKFNPNDDPIAYRHKHVPGDFELESFRLENLLVTVLQPDNFRPFTVSIYSCDLPKLRKQWFFYDFLCANTVSGTYDNSLFTIHPRQTPSTNQSQSGKISRLRIDGVNVDHLNRGVEGGMFSWVVEGKVDVIADMHLPCNAEEMDLRKIVEGVRENLETIKFTNGNGGRHTDDEAETLYAPPRTTPQDETGEQVAFDIIVCLNDVRAQVPYLTPDLSYVNNALIRPIVAYINSRHTHIPVKCRIVKPLGDFDGAWGVWDSLLLDAVSAEVPSPCNSHLTTSCTKLLPAM